MQTRTDQQLLNAADWPDRPTQSRLMLDARKFAAHARICLQHRNWQGTIGNWSGAGIGSSIDFQDHRPYLPGDDPRYIDWAAYARSGHYIMKLYREEVSPKLDVVVDLSRSMTWSPEKCRRAMELVFFCVDSGLALSASLRVFGVAGTKWHAFPLDSLMAGNCPSPVIKQEETPPDLSTVPFQVGSLRIWISDLLYDGSPAGIIRRLVSGKGRAAIMAPYVEEESDPSWSGNVEFIDCETGGHRRQRVDQDILRRYRLAYQRHLASWRETARRYDARLARINCGRPLSESMREEAFTNGVIEAWT